MMNQTTLGGVPLHPLLVHFPVATWTLALISDLAFVVAPSPFLWLTSLWLLWTGVAVGAVAIASGMSEFLALRANATAVPWMLKHARLVGVAWLLFAVDAVLRRPALPEATPWLPVGLTIVGFVLLAWGGHVGARMVYRWGVGTSPPKA